MRSTRAAPALRDGPTPEKVHFGHHRVLAPSLWHLGVQVSVLNALRGADPPVEAHFYQVGPHGTSLSHGDPQLGQWPDLMVQWLEAGLSRAWKFRVGE